MEWEYPRILNLLLCFLISKIEEAGEKSSRVLSSGTRRQASVRIGVFMPVTLDVGRRFDYSTR
jgi:hypothetical protein